MWPMAVLMVTLGPPSSERSTYGGRMSSSSCTCSASNSISSADLEHLFLRIWVGGHRAAVNVCLVYRKVPEMTLAPYIYNLSIPKILICNIKMFLQNINSRLLQIMVR